MVFYHLCFGCNGITQLQVCTVCNLPVNTTRRFCFVNVQNFGPQYFCNRLIRRITLEERCSVYISTPNTSEDIFDAWFFNLGTTVQDSRKDHADGERTCRVRKILLDQTDIDKVFDLGEYSALCGKSLIQKARTHEFLAITRPVFVSYSKSKFRGVGSIIITFNTTKINASGRCIVARGHIAYFKKQLVRYAHIIPPYVVYGSVLL